ncbi:MAG: hypothetical protein ACYC8T_05150 [Myxococcaceae bacterium]
MNSTIAFVLIAGAALGGTDGGETVSEHLLRAANAGAKPGGRNIWSYDHPRAQLAIEGLVTDTQGRPLAGARVLCNIECCRGCGCPWECSCPSTMGRSRVAYGPVEVKADEHGRFRIDHLVPGQYAVSAFRTGYNGVTTRQVETGTTDAGLSLRYIGLVLLHVTANGNPAVGIGTSSERANIDEATGNVDVLVEYRKPFTLEVGARGMATRVLVLESQAKEPAARIEVTLSPGRRLRTKVVDAATGNPISGAHLMLSRGSEEYRRYGFEGEPGGTLTDSNGLVRFEHFAGATLEVDHPDYLPVTVEVPSGSDEIVARLSPGATIHGLVLDAHEATFPGVFVDVLGMKQVRRVKPGPDGSYEIKGLPTGSYGVGVASDPEVFRRGRPTPLRLPGHSVRVQAGSRTQLDFREQAAILVIAIEGPNAYYFHAIPTLLPGDVPVPGSLEQLRDEGGTSPSASDGYSYEFRGVTPGRHTLRVVGPGVQDGVQGMGVYQLPLDLPRSGKRELKIALPLRLEMIPCPRVGCEN